jgi:hypothetical protein
MSEEEEDLFTMNHHLLGSSTPTINLINNGYNTVYLAPIYMGSQATEMKCVWDTGSDVSLPSFLPSLNTVIAR